MEFMTSKTRWGILAVCSVVLAAACVIGFAGRALADDGLAAGGSALATQATDSTSWPFSVYVQYGDGEPQFVKSYTKEEFARLASTGGDFVSGLSWNGYSWNVTTAVKYVTLENLLADAEVQWGLGASLAYSSTWASSSRAFSYEDVQELYFYPNTERAVRSLQGGVKTGLVFGLENAVNVTIGDNATAEDIAEAASTVSKVDSAVLPVMGSLKGDYSALDGDTVSQSRFMSGVNKVTITFNDDIQAMYRLYNPNSGEHFYTASEAERNSVRDAGWIAEGIGWTAPAISNAPVYRLYNPNAGDHHYTMSAEERDMLIGAGWQYEGIGWYSDVTRAVALNRLYNPYAYGAGGAGAHHYTASYAERDELLKLGWRNEGIGWYGAGV